MLQHLLPFKGVKVTYAGTEIDLASVKNKSMPYRTKTHSWTVSLIHRLLLGKFLKYLLIIQAVELICQTNSDAAVFEMHHNDFFAKTFHLHSGVEFYFCGGDQSEIELYDEMFNYNISFL